ncbi:VOC family protein [Hanstruepera flava]|uniref:VOC family protein n=1 Tax=Hanstruepera flava TaxID=2930218 RepID=UPI0020298C40|nr:VOC family protein [Hanstruepera flava]
MKNKVQKNVLFILCLIITSSYSFGQSIKPHTIGIVVSDIEKSTDWYENLLELKLYKEMAFPEYDSLKINFLKGEYFQLELMEKKTSFIIDEYVADYNLNNKPLIGFSKIAFSVPDIASIYKKIKEMNVTEVLGITEDKEFNLRYFIIKDLDENVIQFIEQKSD